jgi:hypothetical protein
MTKQFKLDEEENYVVLFFISHLFSLFELYFIYVLDDFFKKILCFYELCNFNF